MKTLVRKAIAAAAFAVALSNAHAAGVAYFGDTTGVMSQSSYFGGVYGYVWTTLTSPTGRLHQDTRYQPNAGAGVSNTPVVYNELGRWTLRQYNKQGINGTVNLSGTGEIDVLAKTCVITVNADPAGYGSAWGGGTQNIGASVTLNASAAAGGYTFKNWTVNASALAGGSVVSWAGTGTPSSSYTFTASANATYYANFSTPVYRTLTTSVSGSGFITPSNGSSFLDGTTITVTATPGTGYSFSGWGGALSGSTNGVPLLMNAPKTVTATFTPNYYPVTITTAGNGSGSVPGAGSYAYGTWPSFTATPSTGSYFAGWSNAATGTTNPTGIYIDGAKTLTATFNLLSYSVSTATAGSGSGSVSGGGTYNYGSTATMTATPSTGSSFAGWSGPISGATNPQGFTVTGATTVTATFNPRSYTISTATSPAGLGTVTGAGTYNYGSTAQFTAPAVTGYTFTGWSGAGLSGTTNPRNLTVTADATVTANYTTNNYNLTTQVSGAGSVTAGGTFPYGTIRTITATPGAGQQFTGWIGDASGATNPLNVTVDRAKTITANFAPINYTVSTTKAGSGSGSVSGGGTYPYGSTATMAATPSTGSVFVNWSGALSGATNPQGFTVTGHATATAVFGLNTYTVTTQTGPSGLGTVTGGGDYTYGQSASLTAPSVPGYTFTGWSGGGLSGTTNPRSLTVSANATVTANYTINHYTLTTQVSGLGTVSAGGSYPYGTVRSITATPALGQHFAGWSNAATGTSNPVNITIHRDLVLTALFEPNIATVSVTSQTFTYDGKPKSLPVVTSPDGLAYAIAYGSGTSAPANVGEYDVVVTITDPNYQGTGSGKLTILQAAPKLSWPATTAIVYPTALSSAQLNATADVGGTFAYTPATGTVLEPGAARPLHVTFTPDDQTNYALGSASNTVDVRDGIQTVAISPTSATVSAGASVNFTASGGLNGYSWSGAAAGAGPSQTVSFSLPGRFDVSVHSPARTPYARSNDAVATVNVNAVAQSVTLAPAVSLVEPNQVLRLSAAGGMNGYVWGGSTGGGGDFKMLSFASPGTYGVTAYSPAGGAFLESNTATATITVAVAQTINFPPPGSFVLRAVGTNLRATATSGLPVRFTVLSGPGVLANHQYLRFGDLGAIVVQADQDGNSTFAPAPPVQQVVRVNAPPDTTLQFPGGRTGLIHADHQDTNLALPQPK